MPKLTPRDLTIGVRRRTFKHAKRMRLNPTKAEFLLAKELNKLKLKFIPQQIVFGWIADFWEPTKQVVLEVDGDSHKRQKAKDALRDSVMQERGITVIRVKNEEVFEDAKAVARRVKEQLKSIVVI